MHRSISRLLKNGFYVILNEVKDLELINMTRFFASLRMTNSQLWEFFNNLLDRRPVSGPIGNGYGSGYGTFNLSTGNPNAPFYGPLAAGTQYSWFEIYVSPYSYAALNGVDAAATGYYFAFHFTPVPLPGTLPLVLSGLGALVAWHRRSA
jgi:hypothetical protein